MVEATGRVIRRQSPGQLWLAGVLLSGMLTTRHRRAGRRRGVGPRPVARCALFGLALLEAASVVAVLEAGGRHTFGVAAACAQGQRPPRLPAAMLVGPSLAYLYVVLLFAPVLIIAGGCGSV